MASNDRFAQIAEHNPLWHAVALWGNDRVFPFTWGQSIIIPNILKYYDLPDVVSSLADRNILLLNPLDAAGKHVSEEKANELYKQSIDKGVQIFCGLDGKAADKIFIKTVLENS